MKKGIIVLFLTLIAASSLFAQHATSFDDGAGHYSLLFGQSADPKDIFFLPPGGGTLLTVPTFGNPSLVWLTAGNTLSAGQIFGSVNCADVIMEAGGVEKMRLICGIEVGGGIWMTANLDAIRNVPYSWPLANDSGFLHSDIFGNLSWTPAGGTGVTEIIGTANQVLANGFSGAGNPQTGSVTLTFDSGGTPTFAGLTLSNLTAQPGVVHNDNTGVLSSSGVATADIIDANVTYAKIQNEGGFSILGNPTEGPQAPSEITLGSGLSFSGTTLTATGVTSLTGTANQVLVNGGVGPVSGDVTLTTPQDINTTSSPTFAGMTLSGLTAQPGVVHNDIGGILSSSGVATADIIDANVTYAKIQNEADSSLLGNPTSGAQAPSEITLDPSLLFTGTKLAINTANANTWAGTQTFGAIAFTPSTPADLGGAAVNDYPLGSANTYYRLSSSADISLTGMADGFDGRTVIIQNIGAFTINITSQDGGSAANDQFDIFGARGNILLGPKGVVVLIYDGTQGFWEIVSTH